jgi:RHS repeat-associated protein
LDEEFNQIVSYTYDSWGNIISIKDENGSDISNNTNHIGNINPFKYRSYYYDNETNLYYLNSRYYNSEWSRFVNADTFDVMLENTEHLLSTNLYAYAGNNPIVNVDSDGRWLANVIGGVAVGAIFALLANVICKILGITGSKKALIIASFGVLGGIIDRF